MERNVLMIDPYTEVKPSGLRWSYSDSKPLMDTMLPGNWWLTSYNWWLHQANGEILGVVVRTFRGWIWVTYGARTSGYSPSLGNAARALVAEVTNA